jgi:hypothetical protein
MTETTITGTVADGRGYAAYEFSSALEKLALRAVGPIEGPIRRLALSTVQDLIGFWALWHLEGGFVGLERVGMARASIYRKIKLFKDSFGEHPDVYRFPGLEADPEKYLEAFEFGHTALPRVLVDGRESPAMLPR